VVLAVAAGAVTGLLAGASVHAGALRVQLVDAAWTDREHVSSAMGTRATWCDTGLYRTTARGQLFAGVVGAGSTSSITGVVPVRVSQTGTASTATPAAATAQGSDAFTFSPSTASLQATTAPLESSVSFGAVQPSQNAQYGRAASTGLVVGGSGAVSTAGVLDTATQAVGSGLPDLATVDVRALVTPTSLSTALGSTAAADVTGGLRLVPGTVASTTTRDACISRNTTTRAYGVSGLRLEAVSASLRAAATTADAAATSIQNAITTTGTGSVTTTSASTVNTVLLARQQLLNLMMPGGSTATLSMSVPVNVPTAMSAVTGQTLGTGPVRLDLSTGLMTVDLAALTSATTGVNGLPANTEVLTSAIMTAASTSVSTLLPAYQTQVTGAISTALSTSVATLTVSTTYSLLNLGVLITEPSVLTFTGTLNQLQAQTGGTVGVAVGVNDACPNILTTVACASVRNDLRSATVQPLLRQAVANALNATVYGTSTAAPVPPQGQVVTAVGTAQSTLGALLVALPNAVSAQVNVQADVAGPAPRPVTVLDAGELGVTALRIGAVPAGRTAWLAFGSSAAGPNAYLLAP
jgi:hypothetical protein